MLAIGGKKPKLVNTGFGGCFFYFLGYFFFLNANFWLQNTFKSPFLPILTPDTNKLLTGFAKLDMQGENNNFTCSLLQAHLALKHRISKNHKQRIIIMLCSPLQETEPELVKVAKKLKKENVAVDVINFGEDEVNVERLGKFIEILNGKNADPNTVNCHLVNVPSGNSVNDAVRFSPICGQTQPTSTGISGGTAQGMDLGGDDWMDNADEMDPELALALRVSLEESRARQQQENAANNNNTNAAPLATITENAAQPAASFQTPTAAAPTNATATNNDNDNEMEEDDAVLMQALQMSLGNQGNETAEPAGETAASAGQEEEVNLAAMTEEEQIEFALRMSMADAEKETKSDEKKEDGME